MLLINSSTGQPVTPGTMLHMATGPNVGQAWRFEHVRAHDVDGHRVHVTRSHPRLGRIHREFHPSVFGVEVKIEITMTVTRRTVNLAHAIVSKIDEWLLAGLFALVPLAFFEHFEMATKITDLVGFGH